MRKPTHSHKIVGLDFCYDGDMRTEILDIQRTYGIEAEIAVLVGPGGGWPTINWYGTERNLKKFLVAEYQDDENDGYLSKEIEEL